MSTGRQMPIRTNDLQGYNKGRAINQSLCRLYRELQKKRLGNHKQSFKNNKLSNSTCLSKYVWANGLNPSPDISWELVRHAWPYKPGGRVCDLCLTEKMVILDENKKNRYVCLNQRNESTDRCVHKLKFRLSRLSG